MKITKDHALFYAGKKSTVFENNVSIHKLINSQTANHPNWVDKHNDLTIIKSLYLRCKREELNLVAEFRRLQESSSPLRPNRARMCRNIVKRLLKRVS